MDAVRHLLANSFITIVLSRSYRLIYTHVTQATDRENLAMVFGAVQDYIIAQRMKKSGMSPTDPAVYWGW